MFCRKPEMWPEASAYCTDINLSADQKARVGTKELLRGQTMPLWFQPSSPSFAGRPHHVLCAWNVRHRLHTYKLEETWASHKEGTKMQRCWVHCPISHSQEVLEPGFKILVQFLLDSEVSQLCFPSRHLFSMWRLRKSDEPYLFLGPFLLVNMVKSPCLLCQSTGMSFLLFFALQTATCIRWEDDS